MARNDAHRGDAWPATWQGDSATSAASADTRLRQQRAETKDADGVLATTFHAARAADSESRARLAQLRREITTGMDALRPTMDTPAGGQQMAQFLELKAAKIQHLQESNRSTAQRLAQRVSSLGDKYEALVTDRDTAATPGQDERIGPGARADAGNGVRMASWGQVPLAPVDRPPPTDPKPPAPTVGPNLPAPLHDFIDYQLQGREVPPWAPPPPPVTGDPIKLGPSQPRPPTVITLGPTGPVDLFPNCDTREVLSKTGQLASAGVGAAVVVSTGPLTAGVTWAGLGVAAIGLTDALDALAACKGLP